MRSGGRSFFTTLLVAATTAASTPAWAVAGGAGCTNLPEYDRAMGALEGMTGACDMSVEQARRIVAEHDGTLAPPAAPTHRKRRRHHDGTD